MSREEVDEETEMVDDDGLSSKLERQDRIDNYNDININKGVQ